MADKFEAAKVELGVNYAPPDGLEASRVELGANYIPLEGFGGSKIELGVWLTLATPPRRRQVSKVFRPVAGEGRAFVFSDFLIPSGDMDDGDDYLIPSGDMNDGDDIFIWQDTI